MSLFRSVIQDVAIRGHKASPITVPWSSISTRGPWPLEDTLELCCASSHSRNARARHCCLCWAGCARLRSGLSGHAWNADQGARWGGRQSVSVWMRKIEKCGTWLAWPSAHQDQSSISGGRRAYAPSSSTPANRVDQSSQDNPPTPVQWPQSLFRGHNVKWVLGLGTFLESLLM